MSNRSQVSATIADIVTIRTFLDLATNTLQVPEYVREAATRLGNQAISNAMQQDIRSMTVDRMKRKAVQS